VEQGGASRVLGLSNTAVAVTRSVLTIIAATVTIVFMTFFMLLEGRGLVDRFFGLLPERSQPRWRKVGHDVYKTVGGYVTGNLLISVIAGVSITIVLLAMGVPYAVALGLLVAVLDLIPLAGATLAGIVVVGVSFLHNVIAGIVVLVFFVLYQQLENYLIAPRIMRRPVQLSPAAVLLAGLIGGAALGLIGALMAIPIAAGGKVLLSERLQARDAADRAPAGRPDAPGHVAGESDSGS